MYNLILFLIGNYFQVSYLNAMLAIIAGLLPDLIDSVYLLIRKITSRRPGEKDKEFKHHSWPSHFPLIYSPILLLVIFFPSVLTIAICINLYLHFFLDTFYTDDGIRWLWPFLKNKKIQIASKSIMDKHGKEWLIAYRKSIFYKIEWVLYGLMSILLSFNAFLFYGLVFCIIVIIIMISIMIFIYYFERYLESSILKRVFEK
ncbi:MAG: metal-dependent hydrolase [Candidatus Helarchaeota archaeon]